MYMYISHNCQHQAYCTVVEKEIIYITHTNIDGAIPTIYVTYFRWVENCDF